jgi:hypothetical protein
MKSFFVGSIPIENANPDEFPVIEVGEGMSELLSATLSGIAFYSKNSNNQQVDIEHNHVPYSEIINELKNYCVASDDSNFPSCEKAFQEIIEVQDTVGK